MFFEEENINTMTIVGVASCLGYDYDPISKRRLDNYGEEDQFYIKNHHEPIVSEEIFEKAQVILNKRGAKR